MELHFDPQAGEAQRVLPQHTESYMAFRNAIPRPPAEDAHLRHILRYYLARAMFKGGEEQVYIRPTVQVDGRSLTVDVLAGEAGRYRLAICEPGSVTPETEAHLGLLKDVQGVEVIIVHSQYGSSGEVGTKFASQIESGKFRLLTVVPPPFDDLYEYDIWMFEITFGDLFAKE